MVILRVSLVILFVPLLLYILSYLALCSNGRPRPAIIGTNGVKWWIWEPPYFNHDDVTTRKLARFYKPIIYLDIKLFDNQWRQVTTWNCW